MLRSIWATYSERNARILLLLGFASGLPLALTSGHTCARITVENVDIRDRRVFSPFSRAYVFKIPVGTRFMDRYQLPFLRTPPRLDDRHPAPAGCQYRRWGC